MRYYFRYCDHEGNEHLEPAGSRLAEVIAEAEQMTERYDGVEVITKNGKRVWPPEWEPQENQNG